MRTLAASQEDHRREHPDQSVRREKVAEVQQRRVQESEDDQPGMSADEHAAHPGRGGAGCLLAPGQLPQTVAKHHGEHGIGAGMHKCEHGEVHATLEAARMRCEAGPAQRHARRIGHSDEQEHRTTREIGREGALGGRHRVSERLHDISVINKLYLLH